MEQALSIAIFLGAGFAFVLVNLLIGAVVRPNTPDPEKKSIYECGEPSVGSSWVQFDIRFYVVALFYLIFDVEVALIWPIAVVYRQEAGPAFIIASIFVGLIIVGYIYEWYSGSLDWIRSSVNTSMARSGRGQHLQVAGLAGARLGDYAGPASEMRRLARRDPELLADEPRP